MKPAQDFTDEDTVLCTCRFYKSKLDVGFSPREELDIKGCAVDYQGSELKEFVVISIKDAGGAPHTHRFLTCTAADKWATRMWRRDIEKEWVGGSKPKLGGRPREKGVKGKDS
eukprot:527791-Pelagomonas_calceolata.AAC.2